jgi:hypothetical protein
MLQLDFTQWKAQICDNYIVFSGRLKHVTIKFYSVEGSSMWQLEFTLWKAQACDNYILLSERLKYVTIRFSRWKAQAGDN